MPFYFLYWIYKVLGQVYDEQKKYGIDHSSFSILTLVLSIFRFELIAILVIQDNINKLYIAQRNAYCEEIAKSIK